MTARERRVREIVADTLQIHLGGPRPYREGIEIGAAHVAGLWYDAEQKRTKHSNAAIKLAAKGRK